ncbi:MAG: hypothetical protein PVJ19_10820 [Desulfobacteraceae bacterium]|jgi:hypothetical protein
MAQIVEVRQNDCLSKIIETQKGVKGAIIYQWVKRVQELNPHIGNPDLIYPRERILIPDTMEEVVPQKVIWENALSQMPASMNVRPPLADETLVYTTQPGDSINRIAEMMFADGPNRVIPLNVKRAILLHNNPKLQPYLHGPVPMGMLVNLTTFKLTISEVRQWENTHPYLKGELNAADNNLKQALSKTDMQSLYIIADNLQGISSADDFAAGLDDTVRFHSIDSGANTFSKDKMIKIGGDVITGTGYGLGAGSALAASGGQALAMSNALLQEVYMDAYKEFGETVLKKPAKHMVKIERFLNSHPKWHQLIKNLNKSPKFLISKEQLRPRFNPLAKFPNANFFKNHVVKVLINPDGSRYMGTLANRLNGKISVFKGWGGRLTWGLPIILGGISVAAAPPDLRVRTLFKQGFSIVGGAFGTGLGSVAVGVTAFSILPLFGICLSPIGIFIAGFLLGGYLGYKFATEGERLGGILYDKFTAQGNGRVYHSMDQLVESFH